MRRSIWITVLTSFFIATIGGEGSSRDEQQNDDVAFEYSSLEGNYDDGDFVYESNITNNETLYEYGGWQADDPYFYYPSDDEIMQQFHTEFMNGTNIESKEFILAISLDPFAVTAAVCFSLAGTIISIFCACIALYYLKLCSLMRQYAKNGTFVEARIITAEPDINNFIEKEDIEDKRGLIHVADSHGSDDRSVIMAEDDETISYQRMDVAGSNDTENSEETKEQEHTPRHANTLRGKRKKRNSQSTSMPKNANERGGNMTRSIKIMLQQNKILKPKNEITRVEKFQMRRNQVRKERVKCNQTFFVTIEYQNVVVTDGSKTRKQFKVIGEDITIIEDQDHLQKEFHVKLSLLSSHPMSGIVHGEVERAHRCYRFILFLLCLIFGFGLIAGCIYTTYYYAPFPMFLAYVAVLAVQVIFLPCFLSSSFDQVISASYLEKGVIVSNEHVESGHNEKLFNTSFEAREFQ